MNEQAGIDSVNEQAGNGSGNEYADTSSKSEYTGNRIEYIDHATLDRFNLT